MGMQLDVRVAHVLHVVHQVVGQLAIRKRLVTWAAQPGAQMHFVNGDGLCPAGWFGARCSIHA